MFGTIRKHQTWLWVVIMSVTIVSFVFFFSPYQRMNGGLGQSGGDLGTINGEKVTQEAYFDALHEVKLQYFLRRGNWPDRDPMARQMGFNEEREVYQRLLLLQKIREFDFAVSPDQVARLAADILSGMSKSGTVTLSMFEQRVLYPNKITAVDFERFLRHELELQQLINLVGLSGELLSPADAQVLYKHEHQEVVARLVLLSATNYLATVTLTPAAVAQYFTNFQDSYRVPERIQVTYIKYDLTNYWNAAAVAMTNSVTNLMEAVEQTYQRLGSNYFSDAKSPAEAKQRIIHDEVYRRAMELARSNAAIFADTVLEKEPVLSSFTSLAQSNGLTVKLTSPFNEQSGPPELKVGANFVKAAFGLTTNEPFIGPINGEDGAYNIARTATLPEYIPPFDSIRDRVTQDYRMSEATKLARAAGEAFSRTLTNELAQGKTFSTICREAKFNPILLPAFSRSDRSLPQVEGLVPFSYLQEIAFRTPVGHASEFCSLPNGGFTLFVESHQPMDEAKMRADLPHFLTMLRQNAQNDAFNEWFRKQAEVGLRNIRLGDNSRSR